jgi:hypothetical protein
MPIMMKTTSSATTSQATPVKANTGKLVVKIKILRIGEEPPMTALKQSSLASVSIAMTASSISLNQESSPGLDTVDSNNGVINLVVPVDHDY